MSHDNLFCPLRLGQLHLNNRIVMPPMTRSRASQPGDVANAIMATYYAQRAEAGLIISEGANSTSKCNSRLKIRLLSEVRQKPPVAV